MASNAKKMGRMQVMGRVKLCQVCTPSLFVMIPQDKVFERMVIASSGGEPGQPGFALFRDGSSIGAVVNDGERTWEISVYGQLPYSEQWVNIAIRWKPTTFNNSVLQEELRKPNFDMEKVGGLELFINLDPMGQHVVGIPCEERVTAGEKACDFKQASEGLTPKTMVLGCHKSVDNPTLRNHSGGRYDEVAFWSRRLNETEKPYFLGGYKSAFSDIEAEKIIDILKYINPEDTAQADIAVNILIEVINKPKEDGSSGSSSSGGGGGVTEAPSSGSGDNSDSSGGSGDNEGSGSGAPATEPPLSNDEQLEKDKNDLLAVLKVTIKLTSVTALKQVVSPSELKVRLQAVIAVGEVFSTAGKFKDGWSAVDKDSTEPGGHKQLSQLIDFTQTLAERNDESESGHGNFREILSGTNFGFEVAKYDYNDWLDLGKPSEANGSAITGETNHDPKYGRFPRYTEKGYQDMMTKIAGHARRYDQSDYLEFPLDVFPDECKNYRVSFSGMVINHFPDPARKNAAKMSSNQITLDSRVIVVDISANLQGDPNDKNSGDKSLKTRCAPSESKLKALPIKIVFGVKSSRHGNGHNLGRKTQGYFEDLDDSLVKRRHCAIWNPDISTNGAWDTEGVKTVSINDATAECTSTRFGTFGIIAEIEDEPYADDDEMWLVITKFIGYSLSIICLLIFIGVVLAKKYLWEMFHVLGLNAGLALLLAHIFMMVTEAEGVRDDRSLCCLVGSLMSFFYTATVTLGCMKTFALFQAIIAGTIGGRTKAYLCFGWGLPIMALGYNIFVNLEEMGNDARCMVGWENSPKWYFFSPLLAVAGASFLLILVVTCNIRNPAMRKESFVEELSSLAFGLQIYNFLFGATWATAPLAYIPFPGKEIPNFYPAFQVLNSFTGIFFFLCLGLGSKRFRIAILNRQEARRQELIAQAQAEAAKEEEEAEEQEQDRGGDADPTQEADGPHSMQSTATRQTDLDDGGIPDRTLAFSRASMNLERDEDGSGSDNPSDPNYA